jgi:hypothetical protein
MAASRSLGGTIAKVTLATFRRKKHVFEKQRKNLAARRRPTEPVGL